MKLSRKKLVFSMISTKKMMILRILSCLIFLTTQSFAADVTDESAVQTAKKRLSARKRYPEDPKLDNFIMNFKYENWKDKLAILGPYCVLAGGQLFYSSTKLSLLGKSSAVLVGIETGDFFSGVSHIIGDNIPYQNKNLPKILRNMGYVYQQHHVNPNAAKELSYWAASRELYLLGLPQVALSLFLAYNGYDWTATVLNIGVFMHSQHQLFHIVTHGKRLTYPKLQAAIEWLQDRNLIVNKERHNRHHGHPENAINYTTITGHTNFIFNTVDRFMRFAYRKLAAFRNGNAVEVLQ